MKKVFALAVIVGFLLMGSLASAWQNPCSATEYIYTYPGGYMLLGWTEAPQFSPAPRCGGTVVLVNPDGTSVELRYRGEYSGIMKIAGVPCRVDNDGNLVCSTTETITSEFTFLKR